MAAQRRSKDYLQRQSILDYLDRKLAQPLDPAVRRALTQTREWIRRWRPRAARRTGGLGR